MDTRIFSYRLKGMLAAIGLILVMKQIPHAIGYDVEAESDPSFLESDDRTPLRMILESRFTPALAQPFFLAEH